MSFSKNLKMIRSEKNISQEKLAEMLDVSRQAVSKWETGEGYPETEKLILLSKRLDVSLDYLLLDSHQVQDEKSNVTRVYTGTISIRTYDKKNIISCHKVTASKIVSVGVCEPKYYLIGVDKVTFWGEHTAVLGWYKSESDIVKEMDEITDAINKGISLYELKYAVNIETKCFGIRLAARPLSK